MFAEVDGQSVVVRQPHTESEQQDATRAMLACPTGSIGIVGSKPISENLFPALIDGDVYYCGFNSPKSFGANAFFVRRDSGNLLIDSPRFVNKLVARLQSLGGIQHVLLTHRDDVADTERWAHHFGARVWIHEHDRSAAPFATDVLRGSEPTSMDSGLLAIPVPGHTRGSVVYLLDQRFLFSGDSLYWSRDLGTLSAFRRECWYSWAEQTSSLERLANYRFEWVLAGHGDRRRAEPEEMRTRLKELVDRMRRGREEDVGEW
jgi:glyoxylase-like metal-dependent hydrolase (beta-lactamase superfamily II)